MKIQKTPVGIKNPPHIAKIIGQFSLTAFVMVCLISSTLAQSRISVIQKTPVNPPDQTALPIEPVVGNPTYKQLAGAASEISEMALPKT